MKKKITYPDGRVEEFEGTAEELAQLEEKIRKDSMKEESKRGKKRILNEETVRKIAREEAQKVIPLTVGNGRIIPMVVKEYVHGWDCQCSSCKPYRAYPWVQPYVSPIWYGSSGNGTSDLQVSLTNQTSNKIEQMLSEEGKANLEKNGFVGSYSLSSKLES